MIGQHIGEGKPDKAGKTVGTSIVLFAIIGIAMTVILELFAGLIANILQVPAESFDKTVLYLRICSGGILIIIAYNVISSVLRGIGNANLPLLFVGIACAANIAGDLFFVGALKLDVAGAALATVLAQLISVIASMGVLKKGNLPIEFKKEDCRIDRGELKKVLNVGVPIALQETTVQISFLVINSIINGISIPVMIQGITSACLIRIPLALFFSHLPNTNLTFVGMSTPITTVYGICFFMICFARLKKKGQM